MTLAGLDLAFNSTIPRIVSPSLYEDFVNVSTATLTPSLLTSYDTVGSKSGKRGLISQEFL